MTSETKTDIEVESIIKHAQTEANRFCKAYLEQHLGGKDTYPCGFAWVNIKPARGQFVKILKKMGLGSKDDYEGGWTVRNPGEYPGQNMDAKKAGADAFARILREHGLKAYAAERMD